MPQLDPSVFGTQIFWLAFSFIMLYVLLSKFILPRIGNTLASRAAHIDNDVAEAQTAQKQAEAALIAYEEALLDARAQAVQLAHNVRAEAQVDIDQKKAALDKDLAASAARAEAQMNEARAQAMRHLDAVASELTADIVVAISGIKTDLSTASTVIAAQKEG